MNLYMVKERFVQIQVFDDGYQSMKYYPNLWRVIDTMHGGGKLNLQNETCKSIFIPSISEWKTIEVPKEC